MKEVDLYLGFAVEQNNGLQRLGHTIKVKLGVNKPIVTL